MYYFFIIYFQGGYPARLRKVLIVTAPLWFKAPFKILRLFVREKLRERVFTVSIPQLMLHVPKESLPIRLGGTLDIDHSSWLLHCYKSMTNREDDICLNTTTTSNNSTTTTTNTCINNASSTIPTTILELTSTPPPPLNLNNVTTTNNHNNDNINNSHNNDTLNNQNGDFVVNEKTNNLHNHNNGSSNTPALSELWSENPPSSASSGFSDDDSLAGAEGDPKAIEQIVEMVNKLGRDGLIQEYADIRARAPEGSFTNAK